MPISLRPGAGSGVPRSQVERLWLIGGGCAAFALILFGYFLFIGPQRSATSDVRSQVDAAGTSNASLQSRIESLRAQNKNLARYKSDLTNEQRALPSTSGVSDFLRSLQTLGGATQTAVSSLTVGPPTDVTTIAAPAPAANASAGASSTTAAVPAVPTATGPTLYGLAITAQVSGSPTALDKFLEQLQQVQPRAVLITQITEGAGSAGANSNSGTLLQLSMQAFVAPTSSAESAQLAQASGQ